MRPILHSDLSTAARALLCVSSTARPELMSQLVQEAQCADRYTRRLGKPHPRWGNGTLASAAARYVLADEPPMDSSEYCRCLIIVLGCLMARRTKFSLS